MKQLKIFSSVPSKKQHENKAWLKHKCIYYDINSIDKKVNKLFALLNRIFDKTIEAEIILDGILPKPNMAIINLSNRTLNNDEYEVESAELKYWITMKPEKNDIFALAEDQYDQTNPTGFF